MRIGVGVSKCVACTRVHNNTKYICNNNDINDTQKYIDDDDKQQLQLRRRPFGVKDDYGDWDDGDDIDDNFFDVVVLFFN